MFSDYEQQAGPQRLRHYLFMNMSLELSIQQFDHYPHKDGIDGFIIAIISLSDTLRQQRARSVVKHQTNNVYIAGSVTAYYLAFVRHLLRQRARDVVRNQLRQRVLDVFTDSSILDYLLQKTTQRASSQPITCHQILSTAAASLLPFTAYNEVLYHQKDSSKYSYTDD